MQDFVWPSLPALSCGHKEWCSYEAPSGQARQARAAFACRVSNDNEKHRFNSVLSPISTQADGTSTLLKLIDASPPCAMHVALHGTSPKTSNERTPCPRRPCHPRDPAHRAGGTWGWRPTAAERGLAVLTGVDRGSRVAGWIRCRPCICRLEASSDGGEPTEGGLIETGELDV